MTKTAAIKQARSESHMYGQGRQYIISTWDEECHAWREGYARDYYRARSDLARWRIDRARELLGYPPLVWYCGGPWTASVMSDIT